MLIKYKTKSMLLRKMFIYYTICPKSLELENCPNIEEKLAETGNFAHSDKSETISIRNEEGMMIKLVLIMLYG